MMTFLRFLLVPIVVMGFSINTLAQTQPKLIKTKYSYTFSGVNSTSNIENLTNEVANLKGVAICKPVIKPEQNSGQLIVIVEEYSRTSEGQEMFEPTDLKKIIIKNGLTPNELTTEPFSN